MTAQSEGFESLQLNFQEYCTNKQGGEFRRERYLAGLGAKNNV